MSTATTLPAYNEKSQLGSMTAEERENTFCPSHGPSPTPQIDALLTTPTMQSHLLTLSKTLADLAQTGCSRCATEQILRTTTAVLMDLKQQKKSIGREEKRALKQEGKQFKAFLKPLRREMREGWKGEK